MKTGILLDFLLVLIGPVVLCSAWILGRQPTRRPWTNTRIFLSGVLVEQQQHGLQVWDDVLPPSICTELDELAWEHSERGADGSSVFVLGQAVTPLEWALQSILTQIGDNDENSTTHVEYWSRNEYMNLDLHSDIDEQELQEEGELRYPDWGHVLYLAKEHDCTVGPTSIVLTQKMGEWNGLRRHNNTNRTTSSYLVTVPVIPGRVVRFPGKAMHGVPKPCTLWTQTIADQQKEDDDDDEDEDEIERSVLLFNTWSIRGPRGVYPDEESGRMPAGIELVPDDGEEATIEDTRPWWHDEFGGATCPDLHCNEYSQWKSIPVQPVEHDPTTTTSSIPMKIPLLGDSRRRRFQYPYIAFEAPRGVAGAFVEAHAVRKTPLVRPMADR